MIALLIRMDYLSRSFSAVPVLSRPIDSRTFHPRHSISRRKRQRPFLVGPQNPGTYYRAVQFRFGVASLLTLSEDLSNFLAPFDVIAFLRRNARRFRDTGTRLPSQTDPVRSRDPLGALLYGRTQKELERKKRSFCGGGGRRRWDRPFRSDGVLIL